jgi:hypothetical protein
MRRCLRRIDRLEKAPQSLFHQVGRTLPLDVCAAYTDCWRCKKTTGLVIDLCVAASRVLQGAADVTAKIYDFDDEGRGAALDSVERDTQFADAKMRSAGIRLIYTPRAAALAGVKNGILLELGFDDTAPNRPVTISSWALDVARRRSLRATS